HPVGCRMGRSYSGIGIALSPRIGWPEGRQRGCQKANSENTGTRSNGEHVTQLLSREKKTISVVAGDRTSRVASKSLNLTRTFFQKSDPAADKSIRWVPPLWLPRRRCAASSRGKERLPGSPRLPRFKARSMARQVSPGASRSRPERRVGHIPVRWKCASAHC